MVARMFSWLAGLALVLVFLVIISPDLFRGYIFSAEERSSGRRAYETYCIGCHGDNGLGDGEAAAFLNPKPRNFVNGQFKFFYFGEPGPLPSDQSLQRTIRNGIPGAAMPAFTLLTDQEITDVMLRPARRWRLKAQAPQNCLSMPAAMAAINRTRWAQWGGSVPT